MRPSGENGLIFFFGADALETMRTASPALHYRPEALHPLAGCEINV